MLLPPRTATLHAVAVGFDVCLVGIEEDSIAEWAGWPVLRVSLLLIMLFILAGLSIYSSAFQGFDRAKVSGLAELEPDLHDQKLVVTGIRTQVRHPIYLGHLCEVFGWSVGTGSLATIALLVFAAITGAIMIRKEDAELEARFGDVYRQYRDRVPALLPKFPV